MASWADDYRKQHPETGPWHYVNVPLGATGFDGGRDCRGGGCVASALFRYWGVLADPAESREARAEALKFVVHFVGDLHQPLHSSDNDDWGGNKIQLTFDGRATNLHALWDYGLIEHTKLTEDAYFEWLEADLLRRGEGSIEQSYPVEWIDEAHRIARESVYPVPPGRVVPIEYFAANRPVVERQLERAGVRLAGLLNRVFARGLDGTEVPPAPSGPFHVESAPRRLQEE